MKKNGLTSNQLKLIAIAAMFLDHSFGTIVSHDTLWGIAFWVPGRITAPLMCFFISEGYYHTSDK